MAREAQYEGRENRFNDSLPARVGGFMSAVSLADAETRMQAVEILQRIMELPNLTLAQKIDILNRRDPLVFAQSLPAAVVGELRSLLAESVELDMSMTVGARTSAESSVDSKTTGSAKVTFGFGLFKGSAQMSSQVSTHSKHKRDSDYSATTDMRLRMTRHPLPEGLQKSLDAMASIVDAANEINIALAKREIQQIANSDQAKLPTEAEVDAEPEQQAEAA